MAFENDVFGYKRNPKPRGVFSTDNSRFVFGSGTDPIGYLIQGWNVSYAQQVQEVLEIGSNEMYWVKGRPTGSGQINRGIAEKGAAKFFPAEAYDLCDGGATLNILARGGSCENYEQAELKLVLAGVVVTQIGFDMNVNDMRINEGIGWRFSYMQVG